MFPVSCKRCTAGPVRHGTPSTCSLAGYSRLLATASVSAHMYCIAVDKLTVQQHTYTWGCRIRDVSDEGIAVLDKVEITGGGAPNILRLRLLAGWPIRCLGGAAWPRSRRGTDGSSQHRLYARFIPTTSLSLATVLQCCENPLIFLFFFIFYFFHRSVGSPCHRVGGCLSGRGKATSSSQRQPTCPRM